MITKHLQHLQPIKQARQLKDASNATAATAAVFQNCKKKVDEKYFHVSGIRSNSVNTKATDLQVMAQYLSFSVLLFTIGLQKGCEEE